MKEDHAVGDVFKTAGHDFVYLLWNSSQKPGKQLGVTITGGK